MKAIEIRPGQKPRVAEIQNTFDCLKKMVDGPIEGHTLGDTGLVAILNRDGREKGMAPTGCLRVWPIQDDILYGTVIIVRAAMDAFAAVREGDMELVQRIYREVRRDV